MTEIRKSDYKVVSDFKRAKIQLYTAFFLVFLSILKKASGQVVSLG